MFSFIVMLFTLMTAVFFLTLKPVVIDRGLRSEREVSLKLVGVVFLVLVLPLAFVAFTSRVEAKQVGVLTTWGKPSEKTYNAGLAFHMPWQKMTQIDATTQTNEYHGDESIKVILKDKNTADISATIRWAVNRPKANDVYADFRSDDPTDSLRKAVVSTQFKAALNSVFSDYDATAEDSTSTTELSEKVQDIMETKTDDLVVLKSITISYIKPDKAVQKKIDALQTQRGATKVANEKIVTAEAEAKANKILSNSVSNDPNVLVSKCLDLIADGAFDPPAGFSCWPGGGGSVVLPSK